MNKKDYIPRLAEKTLITKLHSSGCVVVSGPKFCGKSTLCSRFSNSSTMLKTTNDIELARIDPLSTLQGKIPHLIDEWQKASEIWNYIKNDLDDDYQFGKYILTGSTTPVDCKNIQHSGAGRITNMVLKPFSLFESKESCGLISLGEMFNNQKSFQTLYEKDNKVSLNDIAFSICRGGWPISLMAEKEFAINVTKNYYDSLFVVENESDEFAAFLKNIDIELLQLVMKSFARNISTDAKNISMIKDILNSGIRNSLDEATFNKYKKILKDLFIIFDMPARNFKLRSSVSVRTTPVHHFIDTSMATSCLGIKPNDLLNDLNSFGLFFEDFVIRDLSIYADSIDATLSHYRDSSGQEVDAIIDLPNSSYAAIEIKINSEKNILQGIKSLKSFEQKMLNSQNPLPVFKMIITTHGGCYKKDDVYIVPISVLRN